MSVFGNVGRFLGRALQRLAPGSVVAIGGRAIPPERKLEQYLKAYTYWSYACARVIAETVASSTPRLFYTRRDGTEVEVTDHVALDVLAQFNPWFTAFEMRELTQLHQELAGEAYWGFEMNALQKPAEIWPLMPNYVEWIPGEQRDGWMEFAKGIRYRVPGFKEITYQPHEFLQFKMAHTTNLYRGYSPAMAAALPLDIHQYANEYLRLFFFNDATPSGLLTSDQPINEDQAKTYGRMWSQNHKGLKNAHKVAVLGNNLKYQALENSFREMAMTEEMRRIRDDIIGIWGVPKSVLGITDDVNRANGDAGLESFARWVIKPRLSRLQERLTEFFVVRHYDPRLFFRYDDPVPENRELNLKEATEGYKGGLLLLDEARRRIGESEVEGGKGRVFAVPASLILTKPEELGAEPEPDPTPPSAPPGQEGDDPEDGGKGTQKGARRAVRKGIDPQARWQNWIRMTEPHERRVKSALKRFFQSQQDGVMARLKALDTKALRRDPGDDDNPVDIEALLWESKEARTELEKRLTPLLRQALVDSAEAAIAELDLDMAFDTEHPAVRTGLREQMRKITGTIDDTTRQKLRESLTQGVAAGESIPQLADRVSKVFADAKGYRAQMIARTETNGAASLGSQEAWAQTGVVIGKEWIAAGDERTREAHRTANGQVVPLNGLFTVGGERLRFPGDPNGSAENVINCRCVPAPRMAGDEEGEA